MGIHSSDKTMDARSMANGLSGNGNGYYGSRHNSYQPGPKVSLSWLDLRVFYIRISKCDINDESTSEYLTLNHVPLNRDTLLEVNGVRSSIHSDGSSTLLRRDRLDKKSEEVTFVSTDSLRTTGSLKFEVFDKDVLLVSGVLDLCHSNGVHGESSDYTGRWRMECETDMVSGNGFLNGKQNMGHEVDPPSLEVCLAGSFAGNPIILTKTLELGYRKKQTRKGLLEAIPENEAMANEEEGSSGLTYKVAEYPTYKPEDEYHSHYSGMEYIEGEDGELSWFNAGVRVGVGIGMSVCLGLGIGVGLLVRTYHGTTRNLRRGLL
ncbi:uncharacterized protein At1g01500-like [Cynara cardunculus var. scolymus]|uniref:uncharacterized protein At1g01500-like n=1 Tax=Cynara cardunculus var. scolymus TaxID=59895 RepID=UPI000D628742|nr:uncharacterized protein At1g01500-like [Cynara cardunculus var. scolymus]XP_024960572.1 uncharacterized protein At1g01500-like [Cynara cardunculus var. scolymus]XP_024960573.1 uncharacterized protein At1g01500-like [Cynara cardunculus var. scolymus]